MGPIPLDWLSLAGTQSGKALHVGIVLWFLAGITKSRQVALSESWLRKQFGISRYAAYRALKALEGARLVSVTRHQGRKSIVTLLDAPKVARGLPSGPDSGGEEARLTQCD